MMDQRKITAAEDDRKYDWGKISQLYAKYRPGFPASFFERLRAFGIGLPGQRVLDLATGPGTLARTFAGQGAKVTAIDISSQQIEMARLLAKGAGVEIDFRDGPTEAVPCPDSSFDAITISHAWNFVDHEGTVSEVKRLLAPGGLFLSASYRTMPKINRMVANTEELLIRHNPKWERAGWDGEITILPEWSLDRLVLQGFFRIDEPMAFTRESWMGFAHTWTGVWGQMSPKEVDQFHTDLGWLLDDGAYDRFSVLFRNWALIFQPA